MSDHERHIEAARQKLEEAALQFARVKTLDIYLDTNGGIVSYCLTDREMYLKHHASVLQQAAVRLLTEMTLAPLPPRRTTP
jgi:hypothetical protein